MSSMIYGSFEKLGVGARFADDLNRGDRATTWAIAHGRHLREEEIQLAGTLSVPYGIIGAFVVASMSASMMWLVMFPFLGAPLPWAALWCFFVAALPFGALAGAIAGAAECRPMLASLAVRSETARRTVVTAEIPHRSITSTVRAFRIAGAAEVTVA